MTIPRDKLAAWALLAALAAWLWSPALHPVHVEGFSASIVALGIHLAEGSLGDFFPSQPFNTEYFGLTKLGAVMGVAGLVKLGLSGEAAMRVLMALGALLLVGGSARLVRHWSGAPWLVVAAVLLLIPGLAETGFFFNDNMLGSGLLVAALAIFCERRNVVAALGAGVLTGMAIAVRTDLMLVAPALFLIAWDRGPLRDAMIATTIAALAALASLWLIYASVGVSPLDAVRAGARAIELWNRPGDMERQTLSLLLFIGLPVLILYLLGLGTLAGWRWQRRALVLGMPVLVNVALAGKIWEVRQLLPLTPFVAAVAAMGAKRLIAEWRQGARGVPVGVGAMIAAILLVPAALIFPFDGPRPLIGRMGSVTHWTAWQARIRANFAVIDRAIASPGPTLTIIADYWDEDRYLHLRLLEQGFRPVAQPAACDAIGQTMAKQGRNVLQISAHQTFLPNAEGLYAPRLAQFAAPCLRAVPGPVVLIASADQVARVKGEAAFARRINDTPLAATPLSPEGIERLARDHQSRASPGPVSPKDARRQTLARTRFGAD